MIDTYPVTQEQTVVSPASVLRTAARLLEEHGWTQGRCRTPSGEMCVMGAILRACHTHERNVTPLVFSAMTHFERSTHSGMPSVWNDKPGRTAEQVIAALYRAAAAE